MINKIYEMLLSYSARKQYYKFFFFLCDKFPRLSAEYDRRMDEMAREGALIEAAMAAKKAESEKTAFSKKSQN